jgi:hypothetical protein
MKFARLSLIPAFLILQSACQLIGALPRSTQSVSNRSSQQKTAAKKPNLGAEYEAYSREVTKHWTDNDYDWLDGEARKLRVSKERLPGGYWKLHVLYRSIERVADWESSDEAWEEHIALVENWINRRPSSVMPRVILADVWRWYAWKARGTGYADNVKPENWAPFRQRLEKSNESLAQAYSLEEKCPEWYLTALLTARGQGGDREAFEELYEEAVSLEPNYYYLYQAKAGYLVPAWYGEVGEWERFAEAAANKVGGEQGDIILFHIYTDIMSNNNLEFMNTRKPIAPRLLAGFRAIDKLYGSSPETLNEACLISFFTDDNKTPAELMKRIGNDYDLTVWRHDSTFNIFRQEALMRIGELPRYRRSTEAQNSRPVGEQNNPKRARN